MNLSSYVFICIYNLSRMTCLDYFSADSHHEGNSLYTNQWVVHIEGGYERAQQIANANNFLFHGTVGSLEDLYHFEHEHVRRRSPRSAIDHHQILQAHPDIKWVEQQKILSRRKREFINDPLFSLQWYLKNTGQTKEMCKNERGFHQLDINVVQCWNKNITGSGVVVSILDDGLEHRHPDLIRNYDPKASHDFNDMDRDPYPKYTSDNLNKHGTRCAGEVAAEMNNNVCGTGVAFNAKVGGIRMLDGEVTDGVEAASLSFNPQHIDIYSSSWGPDDFGKTVDGPNILAQKALQNGILKGRNGRGSIFVWATGNGGHYNDHCSCDGYINSPYTISIGAVDNCGRKPWYVEQCPGTLAVTYSSGGSSDLQIATTDLHFMCTTKHTGTSAAAPLAAGIFALVLQANPKLTWRDLQHLIVRTSKVVSPNDPGWQQNAAGYKMNSNFGFGALDAGALVELAQSKDWKTARPQHNCTTDENILNLKLKPRGTIRTTISTNGCAVEKSRCVTKLEHVQLIVTIDKKFHRGQLEIDLIAPTGTKSDILRRRAADVSYRNGFQDWAFLSVFHWGENPVGEWVIIVTDHSYSDGTLKKVQLKFFGTCGVSTNTTGVTSNLDHKANCDLVCQPSCPKTLAEYCFECDYFCDCTLGVCVEACDEKLTTKENLRHCEKSDNAPDYPYITKVYNSKRQVKNSSTFDNMSITIKVVIICISVLFVVTLIAGISYMTSKMPRKSSRNVYGVNVLNSNQVEIF